MIDSVIGFLAALSLVSPAQAASLYRPLPVAADVKPSLSNPAPVKRRPQDVGVETTSRSVFVADVATGNVLYAKKPHVVMPIASLTKLMTAMVYLDTKPDLSKPVTFEEGDFDGQGESVFVVGETMTQGEALKALLVGSVNAAGNALARVSLGREPFIKAMNEKVVALKLASPVFVEPTGIDPENRADAADVAAMLSLAISYPEIRSAVSTSNVDVHGKTGKDYRIKSTNVLLNSYLNKKPYQVVAAKTGSLPQAGYCLAQITKDAEGHEIVVASLASSNHFSRFQDVKALTAWAFDAYEWK